MGSKKTKGEEGKWGIGKQDKRVKLTKGNRLPLTLFPFYPFALLPHFWSIDFFPVTQLDFDLPLGMCQIKMRYGL